MEEAGCDLAGQRSESYHEFLGKQLFEYLIVVCSNADERCPTIFPGVTTRLYWPFDDPAAVEGSPEEKLAKFRQVRDQIEARILNWLEELNR